MSLLSFLTSRPISVRVAIAQNFALWVVAVPVIVVVMSPIGTQPLPGSDGWLRFAMVALPVILVSAIVDAVSERASTVARRAYGHGVSVALVMFAMLNFDSIVAGADWTRLGRGLLLTPVIALLFSAHQWVRESYLERAPENQPTA